jgi:hypothetical protein
MDRAGGDKEQKSLPATFAARRARQAGECRELVPCRMSGQCQKRRRSLRWCRRIARSFLPSPPPVKLTSRPYGRRHSRFWQFNASSIFAFSSRVCAPYPNHQHGSSHLSLQLPRSRHPAWIMFVIASNEAVASCWTHDCPKLWIRPPIWSSREYALSLVSSGMMASYRPQQFQNVLPSSIHLNSSQRTPDGRSYHQATVI